MSRLIIKGLPARFNDSNLRDLFNPLGEVTDARVIKTKKGQSRCFGFVGFRTKQDASKARAAMHKAFVDTRPVTVEVAHAKGDDAIPRPWSKHSVGSSQHYRKNYVPPPERMENENESKPEADKAIEEKQQRDSKTLDSNKGDADFEAFEEVASSNRFKGLSKKVERSKLVESKRNGTKGKVVERKHVTFEDDDSNDEDDELYQELPQRKTTPEPGKPEKPEKPDEKNLSEHGNETALNEAVSDMDYFKSKMADSNNANEDGGAEADDYDGDEDGNDNEHDDEAEKTEIDKGAEPEELSDEEAGDTKNNSEPEGSESNQAESKTIKAVEKDTEIDAGETGRLMVRNLAFSVTEEELETVFEPFGALSEVHIVRNSTTNKSRGMGFVQFCVPENAAKALVSMDGSFHCGRILHVLPARPKPIQANNKSSSAFGMKGDAPNSTFKSEREQAQKEAARSGKDDDAQHAFHMSADAVAEIAADRHGVSKADLLGTKRGESGVAAVRLAIAEASIQGEAKAFLKDNGVDIDLVFKLHDEMNAETMGAKRKRQSRRAFLIKNLPARTSRHSLLDIFAKYGSLAKLVVVPSGLLAVIQYDTASDARRAYNGLAYTKFKDTPLYLEWLPSGAIKNDGKSKPENNQTSETEVPAKSKINDATTIAPPEKKIVQKTNVKTAENIKSKDKTTTDESEAIINKEPADSEHNEEEVSGGCSVYVKNLSFETRDEQFRKHFEGLLRKRPTVLKNLRSAKISLKRGPEGKESQQLSSGFGFLEFKTLEDAKEAVKIGQNSSLDGHVLRLQLSVKALTSDAENANKKKRKRSAVNADGSKVKPGPKLMVRNVAFEATRNDIRQLFETFGQLKTVRMPRKMDGAHRGFGFVEFVSRSEAVNAYEALRDTHLYGRHLVIEYAKDDVVGAASNMADLEEKAARDVSERKRRRAFSSGTPTQGRDDEKDERSMMQDEMYD